MTVVGGSNDRGSVVPVVALLLVGLVLSVAVIQATTERYTRLARAQWAADAAALAAAASGPSGTDEVAARAVAEANGASLLGLGVGPAGSEGPVSIGDGSTPLSPVVVVEVEFEGVRARAAARRFAVEAP
jgi:uncharacterized membrane protein